MKFDLYTQSGQKKGTVVASDDIFAAPVNEELVRLAVIRQQAHARQGNATVKKRGEVRGGGKKPWRQKGTGRARCGSSRNPIWRSGGVAFGPTTERNSRLRMNKHERRSALFSALSITATDRKVFALDAFKLDAPKTKAAADMLAKLPAHRSLLVVLSEKNEALEKAANNLPNVKTILVSYLNPYDLLRYEKVMFLEDSLKKAEELYLN